MGNFMELFKKDIRKQDSDDDDEKSVDNKMDEYSSNDEEDYCINEFKEKEIVKNSLQDLENRQKALKKQIIAYDDSIVNHDEAQLGDIPCASFMSKKKKKKLNNGMAFETQNDISDIFEFFDGKKKNILKKRKDARKQKEILVELEVQKEHLKKNQRKNEIIQQIFEKTGKNFTQVKKTRNLNKLVPFKPLS